MSDPKPLAPISDPDLAGLLALFRRQVLTDLNCHQWGVVQSFDATKQTVVVQIAALRQVADYTQNPPAYIAKPYPLLLDVPLFIPAGGAGFLTFPVAAGDVCLVLFNDRDFDSFWATGNATLPNSSRLHDLSDGLAIIGFRTKANPLAAYDTAKTKLALGSTYLTLGTKVHLQNGTTDLLTVLSNLITVLKAFTDTRGDTPNATTLTALTNIQTQLNSFLE